MEDLITWNLSNNQKITAGRKAIICQCTYNWILVSMQQICKLICVGLQLVLRGAAQSL